MLLTILKVRAFAELLVVVLTSFLCSTLFILCHLSSVLSQHWVASVKLLLKNHIASVKIQYLLKMLYVEFLNVYISSIGFVQLL